MYIFYFLFYKSTGKHGQASSNTDMRAGVMSHATSNCCRNSITTLRVSSGHTLYVYICPLLSGQGPQCEKRSARIISAWLGILHCCIAIPIYISVCVPCKVVGSDSAVHASVGWMLCDKAEVNGQHLDDFKPLTITKHSSTTFALHLFPPCFSCQGLYALLGFLLYRLRWMGWHRLAWWYSCNANV